MNFRSCTSSKRAAEKAEKTKTEEATESSERKVETSFRITVGQRSVSLEGVLKRGGMY